MFTWWDMRGIIVLGVNNSYSVLCSYGLEVSCGTSSHDYASLGFVSSLITAILLQLSLLPFRSLLTSSQRAAEGNSS